MSTFQGYMRATVWGDKRAVYPGFVQPKHNGIRCLDDGWHGWTREGNLQKPHVQELIKRLRRKCEHKGLKDGELVLPRQDFSFQQTQSAVAGENENSHLLEYHIFDGYVNATHKFSKRLELPFINVETYPVTSLEEVEYWYDTFLEMGYEGLIFRADQPYKFGSAGRWLMKKKPKDAGEFICIGIWDGKGKNKGTPTFRLARPDVPYVPGAAATDKNSFGAVPACDYDKKRELWKRYKDGSCIGQYYMVEFADRYDSGVPQFPVGIDFRQVDGGHHEYK